VKSAARRQRCAAGRPAATARTPCGTIPVHGTPSTLYPLLPIAGPRPSSHQRRVRVPVPPEIPGAARMSSHSAAGRSRAAA